MKSVFAIAALGLLAACGNSENTANLAEAQAPPLDPEMEVADDADTEDRSTKATVKTVYEGFATGNIPLATSAFADEIVWNEAENSPYADQNPYEGEEEIVTGLFVRLGGEWDYFDATPSEYISADDKVVTIGRYTAKHGQTGKEMDIPFVHVWTVEDGKITSFQQYTDTLTHTEVMQAD